jgi:hypothetical protein
MYGPRPVNYNRIIFGPATQVVVDVCLAAKVCVSLRSFFLPSQGSTPSSSTLCPSCLRTSLCLLPYDRYLPRRRSYVTQCVKVFIQNLFSLHRLTLTQLFYAQSNAPRAYRVLLTHPTISVSNTLNSASLIMGVPPKPPGPHIE